MCCYILDRSIRLAKIDDLAKLNEIYNWAVLNTVATFDIEERTIEAAEEWFHIHQNPAYPLYVLEWQGKIRGWGSISPFHPRPAYRFTGEFSVYIAPTAHHQGLGSLVLSKLCAVAPSLGQHSLIGLICAENTSSLALAAKHGFQQVGYYRQVGLKFERWLDLVVVQRIF